MRTFSILYVLMEGWVRVPEYNRMETYVRLFFYPYFVQTEVYLYDYIANIYLVVNLLRSSNVYRNR